MRTDETMREKEPPPSQHLSCISKSWPPSLLPTKTLRVSPRGEQWGGVGQTENPGQGAELCLILDKDTNM